MKIAITGKGGVGKTTIAAALALRLAQKGERVLAIDADPDANLGRALGVPESVERTIVPLSRQIDLIEERTGAKVKQYGQLFKMNPYVSDVASRFSTLYKGVSLLVIGAIRQGGGGCACPENVFLKALITDLVVYKKETVIMDMEPGIEHLGRATVKGVDAMLIIIEPGARALDSTRRIIERAVQIGIKNIKGIANKISDPSDESFILAGVKECEIIASLPYRKELKLMDQTGGPVLEGMDNEMMLQMDTIIDTLYSNQAKPMSV